MIYQPREDSFLLQKYVEKYADGKVLDMGTGSGIQALTALKKTKDVLAVDVDKESVNYIKKINIKTKISDLFSNINEKFDLIIFNPPYLPDNKIKDVALDGGKFGYEVIERFFLKVKNHLNNNGKILLVYSSLSNHDKIKEIIKNNGFYMELLETKKFDFEEIYVVLIEKVIVTSNLK